MAKTNASEVVEAPIPKWDTTVKLGAIDEAKYATVGAAVVAIDYASGEITLRTQSETQPHGRSFQVVE